MSLLSGSVLSIVKIACNIVVSSTVIHLHVTYNLYGQSAKHLIGFSFSLRHVDVNSVI